MSNILELLGCTVRYGDVEAVSAVNLQIAAGEIVTVIGPNGAGKSTLLGAAMGLLPSTGMIRLDEVVQARPSVETMV